MRNVEATPRRIHDYIFATTLASTLALTALAVIELEVLSG